MTSTSVSPTTAELFDALDALNELSTAVEELADTRATLILGDDTAPVHGARLDPDPGRPRHRTADAHEANVAAEA